MDEKDTVHRAAELLLNGASMLGIACPNCHDPIYRLTDNTMFCVTCNSPIVHENSIANNEDQEKAIQPVKGDPIQAKIDQLSTQLESATDPNDIVSIANTIKKLQQLNK